MKLPSLARSLENNDLGPAGAEALAKALGWDTDSYDHIEFFLPRSSCGWGGRGAEQRKHAVRDLKLCAPHAGQSHSPPSPPAVAAAACSGHRCRTA